MKNKRVKLTEDMIEQAKVDCAEPQSRPWLVCVVAKGIQSVVKPDITVEALINVYTIDGQEWPMTPSMEKAVEDFDVFRDEFKPRTIVIPVPEEYLS